MLHDGSFGKKCHTSPTRERGGIAQETLSLQSPRSRVGLVCVYSRWYIFFRTSHNHPADLKSGAFVVIHGALLARIRHKPPKDIHRITPRITANMTMKISSIAMLIRCVGIVSGS